MLIEKIQLKNITTHCNSTIDFKPGINYLMGENGAGKSSILLMIGYVLFDHLPDRKQKNYVRIGSKSQYGVVKLWLQTHDGERYVIRRTIGKQGNELSVTHCETNLELKEISSVTDLREWLHLTLGIREDLPLKTIFENGIGVRQGTFTEPFLRNPTGRAEIFAPLLNVDIYKKLYTNFLNTTKEFDQNIHEFEKKVERISGELSEKENLTKDQKEMDKNVEEIAKYLKIQEKKWKSLDKQYNELKNRKKTLEKQQKIKSITENKILSQNKQIEELTLDLEDASKASEICKETQSDFNSYLEAENQQKKIQSQLKIWNKQKDQLNSLQQKLTKIKTRLEENKEELEKKENLKKELPELEKVHKEYEKLTEEAEKYRIRRSNIEEIEKKVSNLEKDQEKLNRTPEKLEKVKEERKSVENELVEMEEKRISLQKIYGSISAKENQIKDLAKYLEQAHEGICPICDQPYNGKDKDLSVHFQEKIESSTKELNKLKTDKMKLEKTLQNEKELKKRKDRCLKLQVQFEEQIKQLHEMEAQISQAKKDLEQKETIDQKLKELSQELESIKPSQQKYELVNVQIREELPDLKRKKLILQKDLQKYQDEIQPLANQVKNGENLDAKQQEITNRLEKLRTNYSLHQKNQLLAQKLGQITENLRSKQLDLKNLQMTLESTETEIQKILGLFDEERFQNLEEERLEAQTLLIQKQEEERQLDLQLQTIQKKLDLIKTKEKQLEKIQEQLDILNEVKLFSETLRNWLKEAGPKITLALISDINSTASSLYRQIKGDESVSIEWQQDYDVIVKSAHISERVFSQLSGGEQMAVALAIRLAILKILTKVDFAFFDEPTTNLDENKRLNLAQCIQNIRGFQQIFVISHDDTFEEYADHIIKLTKNQVEETNIEMVNF